MNPISSSPEPPEPQDSTPRARLLAAAEQLLEKHGPDGLSIRELARECNVSTMGIYTIFGGKPGVMQALYGEGFARLYQHAASAEARDEPLKWLIGQMFAYRRFALDNVGMYKLMFGGEKRFKPAERNISFSTLAVPVDGAYPSFAALVDAVAACQGTAIAAVTTPADELAHNIWAILHGLVGLEIAGYVDEVNALERFRNGVRFVCSYFRFDPALTEIHVINSQ
jgi:AcrR family transcriptional regulator